MEYIQYLERTTSQYDGTFSEEIRLCPKIFQLLNDLTLSKEVPVRFHCELYAAMGYFIAPYDIYPEDTFGPIGFVDDLLFSLVVLERLAEAVGPEPIYDQWPDDLSTLLYLLQHSTTQLKNTYPEFFARIKEILNRQQQP